MIEDGKGEEQWSDGDPEADDDEAVHRPEHEADELKQQHRNEHDRDQTELRQAEQAVKSSAPSGSKPLGSGTARPMKVRNTSAASTEKSGISQLRTAKPSWMAAMPATARSTVSATTVPQGCAGRGCCARSGRWLRRRR